MGEQKMQGRRRVESENRDRAKKINQLQEFVNRFADGQRSSQVQSRRKEMDRLAPTELKKSNIQRPYIRFEQNRPAGREAIVAKDLCKVFDGMHILNGLDLEIMRGDK